jgi:hypothetical protein
MAIKESRLEVNLPAFPVADSKETAYKAECLKSKGGSKDFLIVQAVDLGVPHCHQSGFELLNGLVGALFYLKDPLRFYDFAFLGARDKFPRVHAQE